MILSRRCGRIDRGWNDVEIVVELEKSFGDFAERAVTANDDDGLHPGPQRHTSLYRRVSGGFGFVGLILDTGGVELRFDCGPGAPRTGGALVDDNENLDLR